MKVQYNVPGPARKKLTAVIAQELDTTVKYLGPPSFTYEVGGFRIDKDGLLTGNDNRSLIADLQGLHGFVPVSEEYDVSEAEAWAEREMRRMKLETQNIPDYSNRGPYGGDCINEPELLTIELPLEGLNGAALNNLRRLVDSKSELIKKSIGTHELTIDILEGKICFPWFSAAATPEEISAYTKFICALCKAAKEQHRVTAKEKPVENEKFTFRVFLIRLGFIGENYKEARKVLLKKLSGNSAFKSNYAPKATEGPADE